MINPYDIEKFVYIEGFNSRYMINDSGIVISLVKESPIVLKQYNSNTGYLRVFLYNTLGEKKLVPIHRQVLKSFYRNPLSYEVCNHLDGDRKNNKLSNLEWCTVSENTKHAHKNGMINQLGEKNPLSVVSNKECKEIISLLLSGHNYKSVLDNITNKKVNKTIVYNINYGKSYKHISSQIVNSYPILKK